MWHRCLSTDGVPIPTLLRSKTLGRPWLARWVQDRGGEVGAGEEEWVWACLEQGQEAMANPDTGIAALDHSCSSNE